MHVLICDDELLIAESIAEHLGQCGFTTSVYSCAGDLLVALGRGIENVGLIITDLAMPGRDGLSLSKKVQRAYGIPVLLISSCAPPFTAAELSARGLIGVCAKPLHLIDIERIACEIRSNPIEASS